MNARADVPPLHRQLMQHDDILGYKFAPGLKVRIQHEGGGYLVKTNKAGFRCDNEVIAKKPKAHRVLVFGDSYTAGDGVSNGKRFSDVIEQTRDDTEVLNFGLSGSGTDQQYLIFRKYAEEIEYDAVVISVLVENIERNVAKYREWTDRSGESLCVSKPWFELSSSGDLSLKGVPVPVPHKKGSEQVPDHGGMDVLATARKMVNKLGPGFKDKVQKLTRFQPLPDYDSPDSYAWRLMQAILARWVAELNKLHVPVMVAVIPVYQYVEKTASYSDVRKRFDEFAKATGAPVHHVIDDLWPYTAEVRRSFRFQSDVHLTPLAHKTIGESIAKALAPLLGEK